MIRLAHLILALKIPALKTIFIVPLLIPVTSLLARIISQAQAQVYCISVRTIVCQLTDRTLKLRNSADKWRDEASTEDNSKTCHKMSVAYVLQQPKNQTFVISNLGQTVVDCCYVGL